MSASQLDPLFAFLTYSLSVAQNTFNAIPGSAIVARYVKSSYKNDPGRTVLELILFIFAIRTLLQNRTRAKKDLIKLSDKEIDELVDEWVPEPLCQALDDFETAELQNLPVISGPVGPKPRLASNGKTVTNLSSYNFTGLQGNEHIREKAVEVLRKYGLGSCGPPGFYGTIDVHIALEKDIASFLGTEDSIIYSQGFSTISSVIPAFSKRGDIIVADRGVNFAIQKGIQMSRSTVRWYDHNDLKSLEDVLESVDKEAKKKRWPLTRRFIITEGIFETDGEMIDLPKIIELKYKYKYRLILDEGMSFGTVGRTGRGMTELYNVPASDVDMIVGSMANGLCGNGGFCAGPASTILHQRINGTAFVFSAAIPALLAVSASEGINILTSTPSLLVALHDNIRAIRSTLEKSVGDLIEICSHPASAVVHVQVKQPSTNSLHPSSALTMAKKSSPTSVQPANWVESDWQTEERLLQEVVDDCLAQGVMITRAKRLRGQEAIEPPAMLKIVATSALSKKDCEKATAVVAAALRKVLGRRR